ncbi:MAG: hypothetical protein RLZZ501_1115 [Pseudomonadota bacterium]
MSFRPSLAIAAPGRAFVWHVLAVLLVVALLLAPALWNGYPLIYFDSEDYVEMAFTHQPIVWRVMTYGMLCSLAKVTGTLWAMPVMQAVLTAWVLHEAVTGFVGRARPVVLAAVGIALAGLTGLPWVASQVLADVFAGVAILGIATLAFGEGLPRWRRWLLAAITALAICVHMSHVAVAAGLLIALWAVAGLVRLRPLRRMPRPRLTVATCAVVAGILAVPTTHLVQTGRFYFSESGQVLQLALFIQNGVAKAYLDEVCPEGAPFKLCEHKEELPRTADEFLWGDSPFDEMGGWRAMHDEAGAIVKDAIRRFPRMVLSAALENTVEQFESIESGEDLVPMTWHFVKTELSHFPSEFRAFRFARQQRRPALDFTAQNDVQVPINVAAELALLVVLAVAWRRRDRSSCGLALVVLLALLGNAVVCGAISNPHDRYQNRVVWLALFAVSIGAVRLDQRFARRPPPPSLPAPDQVGP